MAEFYSAATQITQGEYQRKVLRNSLPECTSFYEQMMELASRNAVRGYLLWVNRKPIAYLYCIASDDALLHELSGYDPRFARFSPGVLLQRYALEQVFAEKTFSVFDFSSGGGQHKSFFSTRRMERAHVFLFRTTPRNLALISLIAATEVFSSEAQKVIDVLGLRSAGRRFVRWMKI